MLSHRCKICDSLCLHDDTIVKAHVLGQHGKYITLDNYIKDVGIVQAKHDWLMQRHEYVSNEFSQNGGSGYSHRW